MGKQNQLLETINFLIKKGFTNPEVGIVLGTGLGNLVHEIDTEKEIAYADIPNFPVRENHYQFIDWNGLDFSNDGKKLVFSSNRNNGGGRDTNLFIAEWQD